MVTRKMPRYEEAVKVANTKKVIQTMAEAGGIANFSQIESASGVKGSVLTHHLNKLLRLNVIEREVKGTYRLTYKTPLCYIFNKVKTSIAYFGLLGKREGRLEPEPNVALKLLEKESIKPKLVYVVTSPEALNEWKEIKLPYHWILCYEEEILDIDAIQKKVTPQLESLLKDYIVILDCTSSTKPATITYYRIATEYLIPLIYVSEEINKLKWLISKETIEKKLRLGSS